MTAGRRREVYSKLAVNEVVMNAEEEEGLLHQSRIEGGSGCGTAAASS